MWIYRANTPATRSRGRLLARARRTASSTTGSRRPGRSTPRTPTGGGWPYTTQNACNSSNWDSVGVYVKLNHKFLTKLFGANINLTDHAVFRLEPAPTQLCP